MKFSKISYSVVLMGTLAMANTSFATLQNGSQAGQPDQNKPMLNQDAKQKTDSLNHQHQQMTGQKLDKSGPLLQSKVMSAVGNYAKDVQVSVKDNTAYLAGKLPSDTDYENVVIKVEAIKGISDVNVDDLGVQDSNQPLTDTYTTAKIKGTLIKRDIFDKDIPAWTIGVETKNGKVFLSGTVESEQQKQQVLNVVKNMKDINGIDDKIQVKQSANQY